MAVLSQGLHDILELIVMLGVIEFEYIFHWAVSVNVLMTLAGDPTATQ